MRKHTLSYAAHITNIISQGQHFAARCLISCVGNVFVRLLAYQQASDVS
jgi:hypothetical protein